AGGEGEVRLRGPAALALRRRSEVVRDLAAEGRDREVGGHVPGQRELDASAHRLRGERGLAGQRALEVDVAGHGLEPGALERAADDGELAVHGRGLDFAARVL